MWTGPEEAVRGNVDEKGTYNNCNTNNSNFTTAYFKRMFMENSL